MVWGTGTPRRELLYSDDLAQACVFLMNLDDATYGSLLNETEPPLINIGTGEDVTIRELAETVAAFWASRATWSSIRPSPTARRAS